MSMRVIRHTCVEQLMLGLYRNKHRTRTINYTRLHFAAKEAEYTWSKSSGRKSAAITLSALVFVLSSSTDNIAACLNSFINSAVLLAL